MAFLENPSHFGGTRLQGLGFRGLGHRFYGFGLWLKVSGVGSGVQLTPQSLAEPVHSYTAESSYVMIIYYSNPKP